MATPRQKQPTPPFPAQHQDKPESRMHPRPEYQAPLYRGARRLEDEVALVTGGDRAAVVSYIPVYGSYHFTVP